MTYEEWLKAKKKLLDNQKWMSGKFVSRRGELKLVDKKDENKY